MPDLTSKEWWNKRWSRHLILRRRGWTIKERGWNDFLTYALRDVPHFARLLELGCAPGKMARRHALIRPDMTIDGVDFSEIGIERTRELYKATPIKGELFLQDIRIGLPYLYDVVCSYGLIEHFDDPGEIIVLHVRHVKTGGKIIVTVPNFAAKPVKWALERFAVERFQTHNLSVMSEETLGKLLTDADLVDVETGSFGGCTLPHAGLNDSIYGRIYRRAAQAWNFVLSLADLLLPVTKWSPWQSVLWCTGRRRA